MLKVKVKVKVMVKVISDVKFPALFEYVIKNRGLFEKSNLIPFNLQGHGQGGHQTAREKF